ncbi:MAG: type I-U CRISPR-associated protein Cas7 [Chloroflexi bacterium]|nr:MAG: type I-U CRISPR-associated protein Cas7 [Chloroflexota bacterium]
MLNAQDIEGWVENVQNAPVAVTLKQKLISVEGEDAVIFPPTYAGNPPYVIDTLADGTKVALVDSVGSQANRMEPIFKYEPYSKLVPQITIKAKNKRISIFEVGHRVADALVRSSKPVSERVAKAFEALAGNDAEPMARLAPTSLVFGVWDSRGEGMKVPRLINSVIRAYDVSELTRSATYIPPLMPEEYADAAGFKKEELEKAEGDTKNPLAKAGFVHVPSTGTHGGVIARGGIYRTATINLVALRKLEGNDSVALRRYVLGLALVAATWPQDGFLRQGCQLVVDPEQPGNWQAVYRDGRREDIDLTHDQALDFAERMAEAFGVGEGLEAEFDAGLAKKVLEQAKKG